MKLLILCALLTVVFGSNQLPAKITDKKDCHCNHGFKARETPGEGYKCHGVLLKIIVFCNTVQRPHCNCTDHTSVLTDNTGPWCARYGGGKEIKWACENKDEWETFYTDHPDERPNLEFKI